MRVLSVFDGISCGLMAFRRAGVPVEEYHAFEIDPHAVRCSQHNFPEVIRHGDGDVFKADFRQFKGVDFLIGGSPCTYWSVAQTKNRETEAHGIGWELFQQYVRALWEAKPRYFIYENNKSMADAIKREISETFGFEPVMINSALVSAQNRERYYWVGKRMVDGTYAKVKVKQPEDMHLVLKDVLDSGYADREKGHAVIASAGRTTYREYLVKNQGNVAFEPVDAPSTSGLKQDEVYTVKDGVITIRGKEYPIKLDDGRYRIRKLSVEECKRLQTIPDDFDMKVISNTQAYKCIGNGWTVNVIVHLIESAMRGDTDAVQTRFC
ncbi:MAG: DNA (cytosine-5-)-methyltransferase [Candidatus Methanomethylophilaceae archaeon]|nr:DNA (cytosine-5-)-methyltransferase [Candidatus Methanomethylophilaceae archaeon]